MADCEQITLAILAGGQGSRMGRPKALLQVAGKPILTYLLERLAWKGPRLLITSPGTQSPPGADGFTHEFSDPEAGGGPLRGILTALEHLQTSLAIIATVDMPGISPEVLESLLTRLRADKTLLGVIHQRMLGSEAIVEPFPLALRAPAIKAVRSRYTTGRRSVHGLLELPQFTTIRASDEPSLWTNLNNPEDFERWRQSVSP